MVKIVSYCNECVTDESPYRSHLKNIDIHAWFCSLSRFYCDDSWRKLISLPSYATLNPKPYFAWKVSVESYGNIRMFFICLILWNFPLGLWACSKFQSSLLILMFLSEVYLALFKYAKEIWSSHLPCLKVINYVKEIWSSHFPRLKGTYILQSEEKLFPSFTQKVANASSSMFMSNAYEVNTF